MVITSSLRIGLWDPGPRFLINKGYQLHQITSWDDPPIHVVVMSRIFINTEILVANHLQVIGMIPPSRGALSKASSSKASLALLAGLKLYTFFNPKKKSRVLSRNLPVTCWYQKMMGCEKIAGSFQIVAIFRVSMLSFRGCKVFCQ